MPAIGPTPARPPATATTSTRTANLKACPSTAAASPLSGLARHKVVQVRAFLRDFALYLGQLLKQSLTICLRVRFQSLDRFFEAPVDGIVVTRSVRTLVSFNRHPVAVGFYSARDVGIFEESPVRLAHL